MVDNFLSNNDYYNKGGLNGKPKEPRLISPKGQSSDNKYELILEQLIHERNELRKYIIDICKSLDIDTRQSVLGANCLEFYAVLCSTAKNKINYMEGYTRTVENARDEFNQELKRKEQECEELKKEKEEITMRWKESIRGGAELCGKLQNCIQALDKIKEIVNEPCAVFDKTCEECNNNCEQEILDIIDNAKEGNNS